MGAFTGRVAIVTGAGRGLGREHALLLAAEGAAVVVNDRGTASDGSGSDGQLAADVVAEITAAGGQAVADGNDVASWTGAEQLVQRAVDSFGGCDILVNNAGILRDRWLTNMTEDEWDEVIRVHLKGHFAPLRFAAAWWRSEHEAGRGRRRHVVNSASTSGLFANPGQSNYGTAKAGISTLTQIAAKELARYDVTVNAVAPAARTRLTESDAGLAEVMRERPGQFDEWHPANVSPLVAYLSSDDCRFTGETFFVRGGVIQRLAGWTMAESLLAERAWTLEALTAAMANFGAGAGYLNT